MNSQPEGSPSPSAGSEPTGPVQTRRSKGALDRRAMLKIALAAPPIVMTLRPGRAGATPASKSAKLSARLSAKPK